MSGLDWVAFEPRVMCSSGHGVTAMASAASAPPALQLRPHLCALPSPSLLLPARILHSVNYAASARCSWSRTSSPLLATPREDAIQESPEAHHLHPHPVESNGAAVRVDTGANELQLHLPHANGATNGAANGHSKHAHPQQHLPEEFLFTREYLESLDYDNGSGEGDLAMDRNTHAIVNPDASVRLRPKSATTKVAKRARKSRRVLPATIAEVLPLQPETSMKLYIDLYGALLRAGR